MKKQFDPTKPVQTRDGRPVTILAMGVDSPDGPIVALVTCPAGYVNAMHFYSDGRYLAGYDSPDDLVNVPQTLVVDGWMNVYATVEARRRNRPQVWDTRFDADKAASSERVACIKIHCEVTEGEGL